MFHTKRIKTKYGPGQIIENIDNNIKTISYKVLGDYHRDDGPALIEYHLNSNGKWVVAREEWMQKRLTHRKYLPAITLFANGSKIEKWYEDGKLLKIQQDDGRRVLLINLDSDDSTPCVDLKAYDGEKIFYSFKIWGNIILDQKMKTINNAMTIDTLCNNVMVVLDSKIGPLLLIIKILSKYYIVKKIHRLAGPAIILDDVVINNTIERWYMHSRPIRPDLPRINRHGKIIGKIDKTKILEIIMKDREYGNALNKALDSHN
ncbi:MAG TPA: hypothetical protein VMX17_10035 [Candidatus Glassbacteria bacterium]|nr:hypothetical protein [Candidatus Glassbacteria bacterium]